MSQHGDTRQTRPGLADFRFGRAEHALDDRPKFREILVQPHTYEIGNVARREQTIFGKIHTQEE